MFGTLVIHMWRSGPNLQEKREPSGAMSRENPDWPPSPASSSLFLMINSTALNSFVFWGRDRNDYCRPAVDRIFISPGVGSLRTLINTGFFRSQAFFCCSAHVAIMHSTSFRKFLLRTDHACARRVSPEAYGKLFSAEGAVCAYGWRGWLLIVEAGSSHDS